MTALRYVALILGAGIAYAQGPADVSPQRDAAQQLAEAQAAAAANAARPGDQDLSCDALQAELVTTAQSTEMQGFAQSAGQQAEADLAAVDAAQKAEQEEAGRSRPRFGQMMRGMATGMVPGADRGAAAAQQAAAMAQAAAAQARGAERLAQMNATAGQAAGMAGSAMRGVRLIELGRAKNCDWAQDAGVPPGAIPPTTPAPSR